jgi:hypothetical protein
MMAAESGLENLDRQLWLQSCLVGEGDTGVGLG